jgi:hypothetical protein
LISIDPIIERSSLVLYGAMFAQPSADAGNPERAIGAPVCRGDTPISFCAAALMPRGGAR